MPATENEQQDAQAEREVRVRTDPGGGDEGPNSEGPIGQPGDGTTDGNDPATRENFGRA